MRTTATHDSAAGTFTLRRATWAITLPIADLPQQLAFYRRQRERFPTHAASYDDDVLALEALASQLI